MFSQNDSPNLTFGFKTISGGVYTEIGSADCGRDSLPNLFDQSANTNPVHFASKRLGFSPLWRHYAIYDVTLLKNPLSEHLKLLQHTLHVRESLSHQEHYDLHSGSLRTFWWCFGAGFIIFHIVLIRIICKEWGTPATTPQQYSYRFRLQP